MTRKPLSKEELNVIAGGVGGNNEATCFTCGTKMRRVEKDGGYWICDKCGFKQTSSDAETIAGIKAAVRAGQIQGIQYPVWWALVENNNL